MVRVRPTRGERAAVRVCWIAGEPTPYRAPHLARLAESPDIDLTVVYAAQTVQARRWDVGSADAVVLDGPVLPLSRVLHHDYPLTPGIWSLLERGRFDAIVLGGWSLMATQLALVWARFRRVPYFVVSESHLLEPRPRWIRAVKRAVLPRLLPQAAGTLVTGTLAREHVVAYGAQPGGITIFPNTVDVAELSTRASSLESRRADLRHALGVAEHEVAILSVGRLIPFKATADLVSGVAACRVSGARLVLVGDGPLRGTLEAQSAQLGVRTTFVGDLPSTRLAEAYVAADVFALVSRRETWGVVVNEAMACGLPLILSDRVGAARDLLEPGGNGELVHAGDVESVAAAVDRLAGDADLRRRYGERSRELIREWGYESSVAAVASALRRAVRVSR